jgi:hypothetical protein
MSEDYKVAWDDRNQAELRSFVASDTGGKLVAHYRNTKQRLLHEAMNEGDPALALHKMAVAKGFDVALAIIDLTVERPPVVREDEKPEEEQKTNASFAKIIGRPAIFK